MKQLLLKFYLFGTMGIFCEIVFTAALRLVRMLKGIEPLNYKLQGESYVWMFFIYGLTAILFPLIYKYVSSFPLLARVFVYAIIIFIVEFITGWLLDVTTGKCPWEYTSRWNVCGYIRLDYLPAWMLFGFIGEKMYFLFDKMTSNLK